MIFRGFIGGAYKGRSTDQNPQTCINLFPEMDMKGGKNIAALYGSPGLATFATTQSGVEVRGFCYTGGILYVVAGNGFYKVLSDGTATAISYILTTDQGPVWCESNGVQVMVVDSVRGYIYDISAGTFSRIADTDFPTPASLTYQDGYFIVHEAETQKFYISKLYDGTSWDALDFASAEAYPDNLMAVLSDHRELWLMGEETIEVFYDSGNNDFPFERINGASQEIGCGAKHSPVKLDNSIYWLDNRGLAVRAQGYTAQIISTRQIEHQWAQYSTVSDAIGLAYTIEGHGFYHLTFPTAGKTWIYDAAINEWHERQSFVTAGDTANQGRHRANCYVKAFGKHLVGDYANGKIYELDLNAYSDDGEPIIRERTTPVLNKEKGRLRFHSLRIDFETGVGLVTGQGDDPQAMLQWSNDGGHTWSNEHWRSIGVIGNYGAVVRWNKLGYARDRVFRVRISDPVKIAMINAYLEVE